MSLFAINHEYQRSIDRTWKDFSAHSRARTATSAEEAQSKSHRSVLDLDNQGEVFVQNETQNAITPQVAGGSELIQFNAIAWGCFLDSKRKEESKINGSESDYRRKGG
jgi:hypothetical protein